MPKFFVGESFTVALNSCIKKVCIREGGGGSKFSVENFLSLSAERLRRGIPYCCSNFGYLKFWDKKGVSRFSVENFLSHSAENFRSGIFYCCIKFGYRKSLEKRGGEYQHFPSKNFCLRVPKNSLGESFTVALNSCSEKVYGQEEEGSIKIFRRKFFVSQCRKIP